MKEAKKEPEIIARQVFLKRYVNKDNELSSKYHLEFLLPITIKINNKDVYFAVVFKANHINKTYQGVTIITRKMAYENARLFSYVTANWLKPFVNTNTRFQIPVKTIKHKQEFRLIIPECDLNNNPFIYLATVLPLCLPKLNIV